MTEQQTVRVATAKERLGISVLRLQLGATLQKHRVARGMTQSELAEYAHLSLKYVGEIERGEANTTLEMLERLARAVGWNPMESLEGMNEPLSEGVRMLLLDEVQQMLDRLRNMSKWLHALNPALQPQLPPAPTKEAKEAKEAKDNEATEATEATEAKAEPPKRVRGPRPSALERKERKELERAQAREAEAREAGAREEAEAQAAQVQVEAPAAAQAQTEPEPEPESASPPAPDSSE
jgi:transcriptional regulator with XRE-family HTH domain